MEEYLAIVKFEFYFRYGEFNIRPTSFQLDDPEKQPRKMQIAFTTTKIKEVSFEMLEKIVFEKIKDAYDKMNKDSNESSIARIDIQNYIKKNNLPELNNIYCKKDEVVISNGWRITIKEIYKKITGGYVRIFDNNIFGV